MYYFQVKPIVLSLVLIFFFKKRLISIETVINDSIYLPTTLCSDYHSACSRNQEIMSSIHMDVIDPLSILLKCAFESPPFFLVINKISFRQKNDIIYFLQYYKIGFNHKESVVTINNGNWTSKLQSNHQNKRFLVEMMVSPANEKQVQYTSTICVCAAYNSQINL